MVFVRVRQHDAENRLALQKLRIGHDDFDTRRRQVAERHADVDDYPLAVIRRPEPIQVQIHSDFVRPTQGQKHKFVFVFHFCLCYA